MVSALWLTSAVAAAQGAEVTAPTANGITADGVASRAEKTSVDVATKQADVEVAAAQLDQAFVGYFPKLQLLARYSRLSDIDAPLLGYGLGAPTVPKTDDVVPVPAGSPLVQVPQRFPVILNQATFQAILTVPVSDYLFRVTQTYAAADRSKDAAEAQAKAARLKARADAKLLYYTWARAKLTQDVATQAVVQAKAHLSDVEKAFDTAAASKADVLRVESQVAVAEQLETRAKNLTEVLASQLRTVMHDEGEGALALGEDVAGEQPLPAAEPMPRLFAEALEKRWELKSLSESALALEKQAAATRSAGYPRVDLQGEVTSANPNQRYIPQQEKFLTTWSLSAQLTWTPNDVFSAGAAGRALDAKRVQVDAQRRGVMDALRVEIAQAVEARNNAEGAQKTTVRSLAAAEESYRVRRSLFQNGRSTSVELLDAETELTRARLDAISARIDARIALVRLTHAVGRDR